MIDGASKILAKSTKDSTLFESDHEASFPRFQSEELALGGVLGRGGFCVVNEIKSFSLKDNFLEEEVMKYALDMSNQKRRRGDLNSRVTRDSELRYAIKKLSEDIYDDEELLIKGVADLAIEAKFLSVLEHPHLIKMRGVCAGDITVPGFFIILDKLYDSFTKKLSKWKSQEKKLSGVIAKIKDKKGRKKKDFYSTKLNCAYDLASALNFLHKKNIIYRDLKPDNIGFDIRDEPKIFDLGLAKQIHKSNELPDGTYKLTGWTGSMKYMAPEIAAMQSYNLSADVYSFGMVFWQILSCSEPYDKYSRKMIEEYVMKKAYRPKIIPNWRKVWKTLVSECWDPKPSKRPDFDLVMSTLRDEVYELQSDETFDIDLDASTKSRSGKV